MRKRLKNLRSVRRIKNRFFDLVCNLLILDEVLGLIDNGIITVDELKSLLEARTDETDVIMTGISLNDEVCMLADEVSKIETLKFKCW